MSEIKLLLDENMPFSLTQQLNLREIDAVSVKGLSMKGEGDESVLERAIEEGRVWSRSIEILYLDWMKNTSTKV